MSRALSPLKEFSLNMMSEEPSFVKPQLPDHLDHDVSDIGSNSSSSFQTEVSHTPHAYGHVAQPKMFQTRNPSPNKRPFDFAIHEDHDAENCEPIDQRSPHKRSFASSRSSSTSKHNKSPTKTSVHEPESSPFKIDSTPGHRASRASRSPPLGSSMRPSSSEWRGMGHNDSHSGSVGSDDTRFSNFSAVPNVDMTQFARLGERTQDNTLRTPLKLNHASQTPQGSTFATPQTLRRPRDPSQTPRQTPMSTSRRDGDSTNLLLDFTDQFNMAASQNGRSTTEPNLLSYINQKRNPSPAKLPATPAGNRRLLNLLDFELPPAPTPRSVPSITIRELESLKSTYLSEISSLKASLSGRDAEVASLKAAVADAERRAGEALETAQEERNAREYAEREKQDWVKKGNEIEQLLRSVREEVMNSERERDELLQRLEQVQQQREEADLRAREAETQANIAQSEIGTAPPQDTAHMDALVEQRVSAQIDVRLEALARELHGVYKKKHETKVSTLKKTYEVRYDKKCAELQTRIDELAQSNEHLRAAHDAASPSEQTLHGNVERAADLQRRVEQQASEMHEQTAKIAGLARELDAARDEQRFILQELERERVEKGELVAAVDEMLALQADTGAEVVDDFRKSMSRPTALRPSALPAPPAAAAESRIGRPGSSAGPKSRMMSNLARMGAGRGGE